MIGLELETVELKVTDRVAWVTLNRPEALNAWVRQLGEDMLTALNHAADDPEVRVIVFTGAGRAFSSGADLKSGGELSAGGGIDVQSRLREVYNPLILRVRTVAKPVIAAVNGPAVGIGCSLALACDLILAAQPAVRALAARLAGGPPGSYATIKRTINERLYERFDTVLELEAVLQQQRADSKDFMEGVVAFLQKRKPEFTGD
jgi:2-(1,2-epoxy-1,2-dihydrophenyl)acetyl-CoA isomerase